MNNQTDETDTSLLVSISLCKILHKLIVELKLFSIQFSESKRTIITL